ncbi:hypothetical protein M407DRAFT_241070 [Tulasnella calospora MUT 4182]|uniref:Inositol-1-monophosphatase n=1 Tax=Tulasnella calospora MUT 4182 TaxID=1051891 RepID=A0A0C3QVA5_9AGAM|nr:hypothetical protein M407DRAFT_241070 [Tulasnella calospora MUT 4182]
MAITLSESEQESLLEFSIQVAKEAGAVILQGSKSIRQELGGSSGIDSKKNSVDLVTEWDVKVEEIVRNAVKEKYPDFGFIGEESYSKGLRPELTDDPTFCVDPIDGTTNFVHGFPFACISIGVIYQRTPLIGVIFNPFLDQLFSALKGHGAFLNLTTRLPLSPPSPLSSLSSALIGVEWGHDRTKELVDKKANSFSRLAGDPAFGVAGGKMAHSMRSVGSAACNYALVASGGLDLYWEIGCWPWDVCAGIVIAQESGGFASGGPHVNHDGDVTEEILHGRKYIVVRAIADTPGESGREAQKRIVKEFYETVEDWDPK